MPTRKATARTTLKPTRIPKGYDGGCRSAARWYSKRRHLAAAIDPVIAKPELVYVIETTDLEVVIAETLQRIRDRDGEKIFKEAAKWLRDEVDWWIESVPVTASA